MQEVNGINLQRPQQIDENEISNSYQSIIIMQWNVRSIKPEVFE